MAEPISCKGVSNDPDQGYIKPCPIRATCQHFRNFVPNSRKTNPVAYTYDFELKDCDDFLPVKSA